MAAFLAKRLLIAIPTIFGVTLVVFTVIQVTPGDPAAIAAGPVASDEQIEELRQRLGLDKPIIVQYFNWIGNAAQGDLGRSIQFRRPVTEQIVDKAGNTALLVFTAVGIAAVVGIGLGLLSGSRPNTWMDRVARVFGSMGISMPEFALGIVLIIIFSVELDILPTSGMRPPGSTTTEFGELAKHLVLPAVTLAVPQIAITSRLTRSSFLQVISQDYIRTARAKGLSESLVLSRHALRNILHSAGDDRRVAGWVSAERQHPRRDGVRVAGAWGADGARGGRARLPTAAGDDARPGACGGAGEHPRRHELRADRPPGEGAMRTA